MNAPIRIESLRIASLTVLSLVALHGCASDPLGTSASELSTISSFGTNPGALAMYVHTPATVDASPALVVALHGCSQTAANYTQAGWNQLADTEGFYVVYPEQQTANNGARCFNWFNSSDTTRGSGEVESVAQMVRWMIANRGVDATRVYVTGLSAGGGLTTSLLAAYPDMFAGGAVMAGLPAGCATSVSDSYTCMNPGRDLTPSAWAAKVFAASSWTGPWPRVSVWGGASDYTVRPMNVAEIGEQWTGVWGISSTATLEETISGATHRSFVDPASGTSVVETWTIPSMGHGTAVDPANGCGTAGSFILNVGICSTRRAASFWGLIDGTTTPTDAGAPDAAVSTDAGRDAGASLDAAASYDAGRDAAVSADAALVVDAAASPDAASAPDAATSSDAGSCTETYASNWDHVVAGRAVRCGSFNSYTCAVGSGDNLGLWNLTLTWVKQTGPGYYRAGRCGS